jgi:hypothetical protein
LEISEKLYGVQKDGARMSQRREGGDGDGLARRSFSADDLRVSTAQVMSGSVQIRAAADSRRVMSVQFVGTVGGLGIKLLQTPCKRVIPTFRPFLNFHMKETH